MSRFNFARIIFFLHNLSEKFITSLIVSLIKIPVPSTKIQSQKSHVYSLAFFCLTRKKYLFKVRRLAVHNRTHDFFKRFDVNFSVHVQLLNKTKERKKKQKRKRLEERYSSCIRKMFFNKSAHVSVHSSYLWLTLPKHIFAFLLIRKRINRELQFSVFFLV